MPKDLHALYSQALALQSEGSLKHARKALEHALDLARQQGERQGEGAILNRLGTICLDLGQPEEARAYCDQALPVLREVGDREGEAITLFNLGAILRRLGRPDEAARSYGAARSVHAERGSTRHELETTLLLAAAEQDAGRGGDALEEYRRAVTLYRRLCDEHGGGVYVSEFTPRGDAGILAAAALLAFNLGRREEARELYRAALQALHVRLLLDVGAEEAVDAPLDRLDDPEWLALALRAAEAPCGNCGRSSGGTVVTMTSLVCEDCYRELKRSGEVIVSTGGWGALWDALARALDDDGARTSP